MDTNIVKLSAVLIIGAVFGVLVKRQAPALAVVLVMGTGAIVLLAVMPYLNGIIRLVESIGGLADNSVYITVLFKITAVGYIAGFTADICTDAGEGALAAKAYIAGRILIAFYTMPIVAELVEQIRLML
jgi:stage III sporulation protein AD